MSKTILVVDDQEIERTALRRILSEEPAWRVEEAHDGQHALDLLCSGLRPQICLVDLSMPVVSGIEFLRRIRRDRDLRHLKAMVTSASRDRDTIVELAKLGIEGYLLKPYDPTRCLAALRPVLDRIPDPETEPTVLQDLLTRTALVVDDDAVARTALASIIKQEPNWQVVEAEGGRAALELLRAGPTPHLCFIDLNMPDVDGLQVISTLRQERGLEALRVAVTSGERDRNKIVAFAQLRIDAYLLKPLDPTKVRTALRAVA